MRKIKRLIALVTVAMFLLSLAPVGALAATKEDAFYRLNGLGVAFGDQNGDPMFDKNYTRAEAAALMVQLSGMGAAIDAAKGATKFSDVPASHWASGVINLAVGSGIIKGYPNGTYKPESPVSYAEMCAMLIQVLGYGPKLQGTWPANVIGKAAELKLLNGIAVGSYNDPAVRGNVFVACDNALDTNVLEEGKDGYYEGETLINKKFDSKIFDEYDYKVADWAVDSDGQFELDLTNGDDPSTTDVESNASFTVTLAKKAVVSGGISPSLLQDQMVTFVWNAEDEEVTYVRIISTKIKSDDVKADGNNLKVNGTSYKFATGYSISDVDLTKADGVYDVLYNVYLNDDNKVYQAEKRAAGTPKLVKELKTNKVLTYLDSGSVDLDKDDVLVVKDDKVAKIDDLKKTDVVYVNSSASAYGLDVYVEAYSLKMEGNFDAAMDTNASAGFDQVKIGGKKFDIASGLKFSTDEGDTWTTVDTTEDIFEDLYDESVKFALNKAGDVAYIITDAKADSKSIYAVIDDADTTTKGVVTKIEVMTSEGKNVAYDVNTAELELDYDGDSIDFNGTPEDGSIDDNNVVKIALDANGKVDTLTVLTGDKVLDDAVKDLNKLKVDGKWYYTNADTKVINANDADDAEVVTVADLLDYVENNAGVITNAYVKLDGSNVLYVFIDEVDLEATADDKAMVIDKYYSNGKYYAAVDIRGTAATYEISGGSTAYGAILADELYSYSMDGAKIKFDANSAVAFEVYGEITEINATVKAIEISDNLGNLTIDADSYVYDMTGDDPVYVSDFSKINEGDCVFILEVDPNEDSDRRGVVDVMFIVDDADYAYDFETGDFF